jgi:hypothetical protein
MNMQLLEFNSTDKTAVLKTGFFSEDVIIKFDNVPTVKILDGYYEVMQKSGENGGVVPVLRVPMANTNMLIQK